MQKRTLKLVVISLALLYNKKAGKIPDGLEIIGD